MMSTHALRSAETEELIQSVGLADSSTSGALWSTETRRVTLAAWYEYKSFSRN